MEIVFINSKVIKWVEYITQVVQWVLFLEASEIVRHPAGLLLKEKNYDSAEASPNELWLVTSNMAGIYSYKATDNRNKVGKSSSGE